MTGSIEDTVQAKASPTSLAAPITVCYLDHWEQKQVNWRVNGTHYLTAPTVRQHQ